MTDLTLTLLQPAEAEALLSIYNPTAPSTLTPPIPLLGIPTGPPGPKGDPGAGVDIEVAVEMLAPYATPSVAKAGPPINPTFTLGIPLTPLTRHVEALDASKTEWVVQHNLGRFPNVQVVDSAGDVILVNVEHVDTNITILRYNTPMTGQAYFA